VAELGSLNFLDISDNSIKELPDGMLGKLKALEVIVASNNLITSLPNDLGFAERLRLLDVSHNKLQRMPESIGLLGCLQVLDASWNQLERLPRDWASKLSKRLRNVNLSHNALQQIPESFGALSALQHLNVSFNKIRPSLPKSLSACTKLRTLQAQGNMLDAFGPRRVQGLVNLVSVDLTDNVLRDVDASLVFCCSRLSTLLLGGNRLTSIGIPEDGLPDPPNTSLRELSVASNQIDALESTLFAGLQGIRSFDASENKLDRVPNEIADWRSCLERLTLDGNRIKQLPDALGELVKLRMLSLNHNMIAERPVVLESLPQLQHWQLNFNRISPTRSTASVRRALLCDANIFLMEDKREEALKLLNQVHDDIVVMGGFDAVKNAISLDADDREDASFLLEVLEKRGTVLMALEDFAGALRDFDMALGLMDVPTSSLMYYRGQALLHGLNDPSRALRDLDSAIKIAPDYAPAYRLRAACLLSLGHYRGALSDAQVALSNDMFDADAMFYMGCAQERLVKLQDALETYKKAIALCLDSPPLSSDEQGNSAEASPEVDDNPFPQAQASSPLQSGNNNNITLAQGKSMQEQLAALSPWSPAGDAYYRIGLVLRDLERPSEAVAQFQTASEILSLQFEKARRGSNRKKKLGDLLRLSILCKSSALQSMNRTKKARQAYDEAMAVAKRIELDTQT
ncbi:Leucine-rich repeat protein SHOC-2 (Protein soc-2 homolog) (Protein sur-8 homolog), partial [Durusdinium trenchii]